MKKVILLCMVLTFMLSQTVFASNDWAKEMIGAADVNNGVDIRIAVIDTGISAIPSGRIAKGKNYVMQGETTADTIGHGTAIANLILEVAPQSTIIPLIYCTKSNNEIIKADNEELAKIIKDAVDVFKCRVINISSGTIENSEDIYEAIRYAEEKGVIVVSSVGNKNNENSQNVYYPAAYDTVIGVGAVCKDGSVASFSQRNCSISLCAPGDELTVLKPNGKYTLTYGTSYATAYVSAAAALVLSEKPLLEPYELRKILYAAASDIEDDGYDMLSGYGLVQISTALEQFSDSLPDKIILTIGETKAVIWGEEKENDVPPIIIRGRTMLPVRFVAEALGAEVEWNEKEQKVTITKGEITIIIYIDSDIAYVNGKETILDSPSLIENDRIYTPIRFVAENLNADAAWDEETQKVIITRK